MRSAPAATRSAGGSGCWRPASKTADLERIAGPCGLDIGADSNEETAVSILAEALATRAGRTGGSLRAAKQRIHVEVE